MNIRTFELSKNNYNMLTPHISDADISIARYEKNHYPSPKVRIRMEILVLLKEGLSRTKIASIAGVHINTVVTVIKTYHKHGIEGLKTLNYHNQVSRLDAHKSSIEESFKSKAPKSCKEARHRIKKLTGVELSTERVRVFMTNIGMKCLKTASIPAKADCVKQQLFLDDVLLPHIELAKKGEWQLFFVDAAHFTLGSFVGMLWCFARIFIKSAAGRNRINVLGAFNPITQDLETVINKDYINAGTIEILLKQLAEKYGELPIAIVLDNARYQHCDKIKELAKDLKITLLFLPPYSPNLNLIERLWKLARNKVTNNHYYDTAPKFHKAIVGFFEDIQHSDKYKAELKSLMTLNFQTFSQN